VKQKVASTLQKDAHILLAGDAAHTHSSAFAQGMNTGVHDATNLAWKLAGVLHGHHHPTVLATYATERRAAAEQLIAIDRAAAAAISGDLPTGLASGLLGPGAALRAVLEANMSFTIGLGVAYPAPTLLTRDFDASTLAAGARAPDALLGAPGPNVAVRLLRVALRGTRGRWALLVFAGQHLLTKAKVAAVRERVEGAEGPWVRWRERLNRVTIMVGYVGCAWDAFDGPAVGNLYFDHEAMAHDRYGIYTENGGIVVIRPDGVLAYAADLDQLDRIEEFFEPVFV
jgi:phenol 2-monooxygenase (NADPH)